MTCVPDNQPVNDITSWIAWDQGILWQATYFGMSRWMVRIGVPAQLLLVLPYLLTILAVSGVIGKTIQPAALTIPYRKD